MVHAMPSAWVRMMMVVPTTRQRNHERGRDYGDNEFFHG